jgi:predicted methyltransferase
MPDMSLGVALTGRTMASPYNLMSQIKTSKENFMGRFVNTIIQGDTLEVLKTFPDEVVDLVITSPPYY